MTIEETLNQKFKEALRAKDSNTLNVIRMVRAELKKVLTSGKFEGEVNDDVWKDVIQTYVKRLRKALPEYEQAGDSGKEMIENLQFEIEFLKPFMPELMGEAETEKLVKETIENISATSSKMAGKVVGTIMKDHKGKVDPALVKKIAEKLLGGES